MYNGSAQSVGKIKEFDSPLRDKRKRLLAKSIFEIMVTTDNYFEISLEVSWEILIFADIKK